MSADPKDIDFNVLDLLEQRRRTAIIEECARVAEEYRRVCLAMPTSPIDQVCRGVAAAIRALKDKPQDKD